MARMRKFRPGAVGLAVGAWNVWRRLTPKQRKQVVGLVREHGPKVAKLAAQARRKRR